MGGVLVELNASQTELLCSILGDAIGDFLGDSGGQRYLPPPSWSYSSIGISIAAMILNIALFAITIYYIILRKKLWKNYISIANMALSNAISGLGLLVSSIIAIIAPSNLIGLCDSQKSLVVLELVCYAVALYAPGAAQVAMGTFYYLALKRPIYYRTHASVKFRCLIICATWIAFFVCMIIIIALAYTRPMEAQYAEFMAPAVSIIGSAVTLVSMASMRKSAPTLSQSPRTNNISHYGKRILKCTPMYIVVSLWCLLLQVARMVFASEFARALWLGAPSNMTNATEIAMKLQNDSGMASKFWNMHGLFSAYNALILIWLLRTCVDPVGILCSEKTLRRFCIEKLVSVKNQLSRQTKNEINQSVVSTDHFTTRASFGIDQSAT